jgi:hypothetical protein
VRKRSDESLETSQRKERKKKRKKQSLAGLKELISCVVKVTASQDIGCYIINLASRHSSSTLESRVIIIRKRM